MKKLFSILTVLLWAATVFAGLAPGRDPEKQSGYYRPDKVASPAEFRIIMICSDNPKAVMEHFLLIAPDGKVTMIDVGESPAWQQLVRTFGKYNIKKIDQIILSHLHSDHIGALPAILPMTEFEFKDIYWELLPPEHMDNEGELEKKNDQIRISQIKERAAARGAVLHQVKEGMVFDLGSGATGTVLQSAPLELDKTGHNNKSLVIKFQYGDFTMLFTGDLATEARAKLMKSNKDIKADVLKTAHHGGAYGTDSRFVQRVAPKVAVSSMPQWLSEDPRGLDVDAIIQVEEIPHFRSWEFNETYEMVIATDGSDFYITPYGKENK
ncbi:MAG: MBL fold metallo-hydrolase [Lentisphaerae bacterium]|nr:MBL fold metallo-hydrolase [Lentisphaerota bacterium]